MTISPLIPENYPAYIKQFHRLTYADAFSRYAEQAEAALLVLSDETKSETAIALLMDRADSFIYTGRFGRKLRQSDLRQFLFTYFLPAVGLYCHTASALIPRILQAWNEKHPEMPLVYISYDEICSGFRNTYMGFEIGGKK